MIQKLLLLFIMLVAAFSASAQNMLILHQKSGGDVNVLFCEKPVATFDGTELVIAITGTTLRFSLSDIESITYAYSVNSVTSLTILDANAGESRVYDMNGRLVKTFKQGEAVQVSELPEGLYIIKNNNTTYKIRKQ